MIARPSRTVGALSAVVTLAALLLATSAHAQVYKCRIGGQMVFSDQPCAADAKPIDVRPASGPAGAVSAQAGAPVPTLGRTPQERVAAMERDRKRRDLDWDIQALEREMDADVERMQSEMARLKASKSRANNNLAGATWEASISQEMQAVAAGHRVKSEADAKRLEGLKRQREAFAD